jgi:hypothetical protein
MTKKRFIIQFSLGLILAITAALLMVFDVLALPARITILLVGISLIATSNFKLLK